MQEPAALFESIGGPAAVAAAVDDLYQRLVNDPAIARYWDGIDLEQLMAHQRAFLGYILGGPDSYRGRGMREAHAGLGIRNRDFDRVCQHLLETFRGMGIGEGLAQQLIGNVAALRGMIVTR